MRLICPNCAAQYEVDEAVIPEAGRDVQCSNCGHTWWQERAGLSSAAPPEEAEPESPEDAAPGSAASAAAALAAVGRSDAGARDQWPEEDAAWQEDEPLPSPATGMGQSWPEAPDEHVATAGADSTWPEAPAETVAAAPEAEEEAPSEPEPAYRSRTPRSLDDAVLDVLREEAQRESRAREAESTSGVESQPELGLAAAMQDRSPADEAEDEDRRPERRARRSQLPDVDEINSTLSSSRQTASADTGHPVSGAALQARRTGFRTGFTLMIVIAIAIGAIYSYADRIVASVPATAPAMQVFVSTVDYARAWLDKAALSATEAISGLTDKT